MRLRTILTLVTSGVGAIAIAVALALVILTSSLYQTGVRLAGATERVRLLMELESDALQRVRRSGAPDDQRAAAIIEQLHATSGPELSAEIDELGKMIRSLGGASTTIDVQSRLDALLPALRDVVAREDQRARTAMVDAAAWAGAANVTGAVTIVVLLAGMTAVLAWLWRGALQPLVSMVEAIDRFSRGDRTARVDERGAGEIRQVAAAFNDMTASLERQREQQLAFVGGVAHDLHGPLHALQVAAALVDQPGHPGADGARVRDRIRRQIERMEHMLGDLLDRTKIETGRFELDPRDCDLRNVLARVVDVHRDSASAREFRLLLPRVPVVAMCDPLRIEQVVGNLLSNAVKYSPDPSGIEIALASDGLTAVLSVTDHGIGMSPADRERLFEPFRRGGNVGDVGGSGLGMSVTRKIVEAHGGRVEVRSELGRGTTVSVLLPLARTGRAVASEREAWPGVA